MRRLSLLLASALLLGGCGRDTGEKQEVLVFAAASLRESLEELGTAFEQETGTHVVFNFAGSNDLARQIQAARGMDVFLSASEAWMDTVETSRRLVPETRRDLLSNTLVIVGRTDARWRVDGPCALASLPFEHLSLGDPAAVPAGTYAKKWMQSVECGGRPLWDAVSARVAPAPDVRAALGVVLADPDVIGVVYRTDQLAFPDRTRVLFEVKDGPPIRYVVAQVAEGANPEGARRFREHLAGSEAARVFAAHGFARVPALAADSQP